MPHGRITLPIVSAPIGWPRMRSGCTVALVALTVLFAACTGEASDTTGSVTPIGPAATAATTPGSGTTPSGSTADPAAPDRPNIVLVLMDDLSTHMMEIGFHRSTPGDSTLEALMAAGTTFPNFFNTTPLCCPSRASLLTGMFAHNHLVYGNKPEVTNGFGGFQRFDQERHEERSLPVALSAAGYRTVFIGKYLNGYQQVAPDHVPPGWDRWMARLGRVRGTEERYFTPRFNIDGTFVEFGLEEPDYLTDIEAALAVEAIEELFPGDAPAFILVSTSAPHTPAVPAPRHDGAHRAAGVQPDTPPSCEEDDITDKPGHIRVFRRYFEQNEGLGYVGCWGEEYEAHLDQTLALDELLAEVLDAIARSPDADNTYLVVASDNGRVRGEHWVTTKGVPYEESIRTPMIVVGPGVPAGVSDGSLVLNIDLGPTFLDLAEAVWPQGATADGESLRALWAGESPPWRASVLVELMAATPRTPAWWAVRTFDHIYIEYETGEVELYDLAADPWQLDSITASVPTATTDSFSELLDVWLACAGASCEEAGRLPVPQP